MYPRAAGIDTKLNAEGEGTHACLDIENRPPTPDGIRRYRKTYHAEPGSRIVHHGLIQDMKKMDYYQKHGVTTLNSEHVDDVFASMGPRNPSEEYEKDQQESIYESHKKEPLGKSYSRNHVLPRETNHLNFAFGIPSGTSDDAKGLIYPKVDSDPRVHKAMYIKSHGSYEPAEQRDRNYAWDKTEVKDPSMFAFGKSAPNPESNGVGMCLNKDLDPSVPQTRITHHRVEKHKSMKDMLGCCRNLGSSVPPPKTHVFGVTGGVDAWGAKQCIEGDYSVRDQMPDPDLGCATQPGWRNSTTETRSFGVPTIRTDILPPYGRRGRSIADNSNYGDDTSAAFLVNPDQYAECGLDDTEFAQAQSKRNIRSVFDGIADEMGYSPLTEDEFERIWNQATGMNISGVGNVCVEEFRMGLNEFLDAKEDGELNSWLAKTSI